MIPRSRGNGQRIKPGFGRFLIPKACTRRHPVKNLDHLGTQATLEFTASSQHVFSGHPALLVGRGPQRHVNMALQNAMPSLHAITGSPYILDFRGHVPIHLDRISGPKADAGGLSHKETKNMITK